MHTIDTIQTTSGQKENVISLMNFFVFGSGKAHANRRDIVGQQHATLFGPTCCVRLHGTTTMLALIVCVFFFKKKITRRVRRRFHEVNIVVAPCKRAQHCCATLRRSQNNRNVGTCYAKSLTVFKLYATSANKCQHCCGPCKRTQHVRPTMSRVVGQQCCVRLHEPFCPLC